MIRLFLMVLRAPFLVHFLIAGGVVAIGLHQHGLDSASYAEKQRLAQSAPPEIVSIVDFRTELPSSMPVEVNLRAQIAIEHNINLVKTKDGETVLERPMYVLVAPDAAGDTKIAYGAVILHDSELDLFANWASQRLQSDPAVGAMGPILTLNGLRDRPYETSHIMNALREQGFVAAENFIYVDPFLKGREAGLALSPRDTPMNLLYVYYIAAFFVSLGLLKLGLGLRNKGQSTTLAKSGNPEAALEPSEAEPVQEADSALHAQQQRDLPHRENDFIGALARKSTAQSGVADAKKSTNTAFSHDLENKVGGKVSKLMRKAVGVGAAILIYLLFINFSSSLGMPTVVSFLGGGTSQTLAPKVVTTVAHEPKVDAPADIFEKPARALVAPGANEKLDVTTPPDPRTPLTVTPVSTGWATTIDLSAMFARAAHWAEAVRTKAVAIFAIGAAGPPLWLLAGLLGALLVIAALFMLRQTGHKGKNAGIDPFERLLQRRLAEKAHTELKGLAVSGLLQA